jgi:hypothetical protein
MISFSSYPQVPQNVLQSVMRFVAVALLCGVALITSANGQQGSDAPLTNASVVKLVRAGFKEKTVISIIHSRPNHFTLGTDQLVQLKHDGVSENIIMAMMSQDESFIGSGDDWGDESFFKDKNNKSNEGDSNQQEAPGTNIFGSSGGSKGQTRSRGSKGTNQDETISTGSATVRILRPPTEGGGSAAPKLEKTPTLDNEAIMRLIDAGFSEGTIIKRIEDSPAEFDLSAAKLSELRKRRVTDPIIAAMSAAMGGKENESKPNAPNEEK